MDINREIKWFSVHITNAHVHGNNILTQLKNCQKGKLTGNQKGSLLSIIIPAYKNWKSNNDELIGYSDIIIRRRAASVNKYKNQIKDAPFSAQTKFHSTVIEEFLFYLFRDWIQELNSEDDSPKILLGRSKAYSNLYFAPKNLSAFIATPTMRINVKNQDFTIYRKILIKTNGESKKFNVPIVAIECKTYLDKTMLEGAIATADKIKNGNPYCLFMVVTELYEVSYDVDPTYSRIDQIYVLRKGNGANTIDYEVVKDLFNFVIHHLKRDWSDIKKRLETEGKIL